MITFLGSIGAQKGMMRIAIVNVRKVYFYLRFKFVEMKLEPMLRYQFIVLRQGLAYSIFLYHMFRVELYRCYRNFSPR